jgi:cyanoexosortase A
MKELTKSDRFWLFGSLIGFTLFYLNLTWKTTGDIDRLTTDSLFWVAILWLLWQRRDKLSLNSDIFSTLFGLSLIVVVLVKTVSLFWFESTLLPLTPFIAALALALIASGFKGLRQYWRELLFAWFLFCPTGIIGLLFDRVFHITVINAKFAAYFLYYLGFNVATKGNQVFLNLLEEGKFTAVVDYPCAGVPMIFLMLKLCLLLLAFFPFKKIHYFLLPSVSVGIGFILGVIRVSILTLMIPQPAKFEYWHGTEGAQIFSTAAILIFSCFCYWIMQRQNLLDSPSNQNKPRSIEI